MLHSMLNFRNLTCAMLVLVLCGSTIAQNAPSTGPSTAPSRAGRPPAKPINPALPTLWIIGDSTVKNGSDTGGNGQWGWGNPIAHYFDETKINIQNRALGGTSSRTFYRDQWPAILEQIKPGDYVIMQFGHNDGSAINDNSRARGTIRDNSDRVEEIDNILTGKHEVVHSYGWYLRQYWNEAKTKGAAMAIYCSPIPRRNFGPDGKIRPDSYGPIAKQAADQVGQPYIDLNERVIKEYEKVGPEKVAELYFTDADGLHTDWAGAVLNADIVVQALKDQKNPLVQYLKPEAPKDLKHPSGRAR